MKLKVLKPFINKENKKQIFEAGAIIDIDDVARINDIVKRGLGEVIEQSTGAGNETPAPTTVADEKPEEKKKDEKPKAGRSSQKSKKAKEVEEQPEEGDANPAPEEVVESEGAEPKEE